MKKKQKAGILMLVENSSVPSDVRVWNEARALVEDGYRVSIISPKGRKREKKLFEIIDNIAIYRYPLLLISTGALGYLWEYSAAFVLTSLLALLVFFREGFQAIHTANPPDLFFLIGLFFKFFRVKFIFDHHDLTPESYVVKFGRRDLFYKLQIFFERMSFRLADLVISTNEFYRTIALQRGRIKPESVYIVRNGPDLEHIAHLRFSPDLRKTWNKQFLVGYVGIIGVQEGIENLLKIAEYIIFQKKRNDILFVIIGDGAELPMMLQLRKKMSLDSLVWFTGRLLHREAMEIISTVDVCVNPESSNEYSEKSTMIKLMEYMSLGKPIVQYNQGEAQVTVGDAALYAREGNINDFADKILTLLSNPKMREDMGRLGSQRIANVLEWKYQKVRLLDAYASTVFPEL